MLDRQKGKYVVECDGPGCSEVLDTEMSDFGSAREVMREQDWKSVKRTDGEWAHFCPDCK